ncbi:hypothetical protein Q4543_15030 [Salipiger sp. 1_MG-2023]|uniref:hypothetical protein n=1 Tax=Salipiger sp. 1_MG-2023 TaxID=3062665 RepID=UPI0026E2FB23|nr:hypothetical protein [Salipiger sp. 1_MG-2023]MDO6586825.1 hypothetical protein [Salipiger sp. 1_MG-2023]
MLTTEFFDLSLSLQAALAAGYLGYVTAYAGFRRDHAATDAVFISLAFASLAMLAFVLLERFGLVASFIAAFVTSLLSAGLWRKWGRKGWLWCVGSVGVHRDDGAHGAWSGIVQTDRRVGQVSVHTVGGRVLYMNDRSKYHDAPWGGLYLGGDGSVVMVVEEEELSDGREEERTGINDELMGTRMTYIPASHVARVNIRMK